MREVQEFMFKIACENATTHSLFNSLQRTDKNGFYGYDYLGNSLYGNSLINLANTGGSKQCDAQEGVMVCVLVCPYICHRQPR